MQAALKKARTDRGHSTREAAELIGISKSFYVQIENGTRFPSFKVAQWIGNVYDLDPIGLIKKK